VEIQMRARGLHRDEVAELREHLERRLPFALGRFGAEVQQVTARVADENGPRGGVDKRCTIRASLPGAPPVIIEQQEADLYVAIDRAADRAARAVSRRLEQASAGRRNAGSTANGSLDAKSPSR
jgi:ribosome-associated translation inhibitor RaiA